MRGLLTAALALAVAVALFALGFALGPLVARRFDIPVLPLAPPQAAPVAIVAGHPRWVSRVDVCVAPVGEMPSRRDCQRMPADYFPTRDACELQMLIATYGVTLEAAKTGNEVAFRIRCVQEFTA